MPMSPQPVEHKNRIAFSDLGRKSDLGANWDNGVRAGLFACEMIDAPANANANIGCRLAIHARSRFFMENRTARDLGFALRSGQKNRRNTNRAGVASSLRANVAPTPYLGCKPDLGASWVDGVRAGLFACNLNNPASNANTNIGCRLAIRARSRLFMESRTARDLGIAFRSGQENRRNTNRTGAASSLRVSAAPAPGNSMAKRAKHIWPDMVSFGNLLEAWRKVQLGKRYRPAVVRFRAAQEDNLLGLRDRLQSHTWEPSPCRRFRILEVKPRTIDAPTIGDCVVHHAAMNLLEPWFERRFIADSYACRKGKGTHAASLRTREFMRAASAQWGRPYVLKGDIAKYFSSIDHNRLLSMLPRIISDPDVLWLFERIVRHNGYEEKGLPLGCLTSQWLANLYLDALDHYVKDDMGVKYYVRYMDDFVIIGPSKAWCWATLESIRNFVEISLLLRLNPKTGVWPISRGIDFVGYRHWTDHVLPRKRTIKRARTAFRSFPGLYRAGKIDLDYIRSRVVSFTGYMAHCDGHTTLEHILARLVLTPGARRSP